MTRTHFMAAVALGCVITCASCTGRVGTIEIAVVTEPGSDLLSRIQCARITLDDPATELIAERGPGGLSLEVDVPAGGELGLLAIEGYADGCDDASPIAFGKTGPLPIQAIDAAVTVFVAAPMSIAQASATLEPARSEIAVSPLSFGFAVAGGRTADGAVAGDVAVYSVYDHAFQPGQSLPEPRAGMAAVTGAGSRVYLFGGRDALDLATGDCLRFDALVPPAGQFSQLVVEAGLERSGARATAIGGERFMATGPTPALIDGITGTVAPFPGPSLAGTATSALVGGVVEVLFAGEGSGTTGAVAIVPAGLEEIDAPAEIARTGHETVVLPDASMLTVGGATAAGLAPSAVRYEPAIAAFTVLGEFLATPRRDAAVAATESYVIAAGGTDADGAVLADVEVYEARTLARVAVLPLTVARTRARAVALANGQVAILGGVDASGGPSSVVELFTPDR